MRASSKTHAGFTLLEVIIVTVLASIIIMGISRAMLDGQHFTTFGIDAAYWNQRTQKALREIVWELQNSDTANVVTAVSPPLGPNTTIASANSVTAFSFRTNQGWNTATSAITWGNIISYNLVADADNPGSFTVDRVENGVTKTILKNLPDKGFRVAFATDHYIIQLVTETDIKDFGTYTATATSSVSFKNQ